MSIRLHILSLLSLAYLVFPISVFAEPPEFAVCEGLAGPAAGLCRAGVATGCADGTGDPEACFGIETNYMRVTGEPAPWLPPPATCPCDYELHVPLTADAWSDEVGDPKTIAFLCDASTAVFQAANPLPQLPVVAALITTQTPPQNICQAVGSSGGGEVSGNLSAAELAACRDDVLDYATAFLTLYPGWPHVDACTAP